jgi:hypothetical protein
MGKTHRGDEEKRHGASRLWRRGEQVERYFHLGLPTMPINAVALQAGTTHPLSGGADRTLTITLASQASEILVLSSHVVYLPLVLK